VQATPREYPEPADGEHVPSGASELDAAPVVAVPTTPAELAERLSEMLVEATDPETWESVLTGAAHLAGAPGLASAVAPLIGKAREALGRGEAGVWYLEPEYDAARLALALAGRVVARRAPTWGWSDHRRHRVDEVLDIVGERRQVTLLATPTGAEGRLEAHVLAERLAGNREVRTVDEHQARLRLPSRRPPAATWTVRAERGRQGTILTLHEVPVAAFVGVPAARDRLSWHGMANPVPAGSQRVPTREADLLRWASPYEADRFDAWAAERLARNIDWWEADWDERRLFTRLRTTRESPALPGRVLLAIGLATKQASAHQPAVAVTRRLLDAGLLGPQRFATTVAELAPVLDPARLSRTFGALRATHPYAVTSVLAGALPSFPVGQRGLGALIGLYADLIESIGWSPAPQALRSWLGAMPDTGPAAMSAQRALQALTI